MSARVSMSFLISLEPQIISGDARAQSEQKDKFQRVKGDFWETLTVDSLKVAILAALHIADEYHRLKSSQDQIDQQLASRSAECAEMLDRVLKHRDAPPQQEFETEQ